MTIIENEDGQTVELDLASPSWSVRRLLSLLEGLSTSDEEFHLSAEFAHRGGILTLADAVGKPVLTIIMRGLPDEDEAAAEAEAREREDQ